MVNSNTKRKVLAVLAGGAVLGVGVAVTLAAWNDSEFATGTFTAGSFNIEGSTTAAGGGYDDHNVDDGDAAASLTFQLPAVASAMSPGDVVYAPFWVRLDDTTTNNATLIPAGIEAGTSGNEAHLSYTVTAIGAADTCGSGATGTVVATGATLAVQSGAASVPLSKGATQGTPGAPVQLCIAVTAGVGLLPSTAGIATWTFTATSVAN